MSSEFKWCKQFWIIRMFSRLCIIINHKSTDTTSWKKFKKEKYEPDGKTDCRILKC